MRKMYSVNKKSNPRAEVIVRKFLLNNSDVVELCHIKKESLKNKKNGGENDPAFIKVKNNLQKYFLERDSIKFKTARGRKDIWEHYFYTLSPEIKKIFAQETLIWNVSSLLNQFYGFDDPAFIKKKELIGKVVSDEREVFLYLTPVEKKKIEQEGVFLIKCFGKFK